MANSTTRTLRDEKLIKTITEGLDLNNPEDINKIYKDLQSGIYSFDSDLGREFDDKIYELHKKVLNGEIKNDASDKNKKSGIFIKNTSKQVKTEVQSKEYKDKINALVEIELRKRERRRRILILISAFIAVASLGYFGIYNYFASRTTSEYESLSALKGSEALLNNDKPTPKPLVVVHKEDIVIPDILDEYKTLYEKNRKMIGWLKIDGTKIDYPVMQTSDNEYYLTHNFNQEKDNNGSLFLDCNCDVYPLSTNMIIYGHHMKSGNMFGYLQRYAKESYYREHSLIHFDTIYEKGTYEVMYAFYSKVYDNNDLVFKYYQFINANSQTEFDYYMKEMESLSLYNTGVKASYGDTLLTLSTCDHSQTDGRFAVVAKRIN